MKVLIQFVLLWIVVPIAVLYALIFLFRVV